MYIKYIFGIALITLIMLAYFAGYSVGNRSRLKKDEVVIRRYSAQEFLGFSELPEQTGDPLEDYFLYLSGDTNKREEK